MIPKKILIIDDDPGIRDMLSQSLRTDKFEVLTAENGDDGARKLREHAPTVVLLDLLMPGSDGFEFLDQVKPTIADPYIVIVLTGTGYDEEIARCFSLGVNTFLRKPCNIIELRESVMRAYELKRFQMERADHLEKIEAASKSLRESEERLTALLHAIQAGVVLVDPETETIIDVNAAALDIIEDVRENVLNQRYAERFYPNTLGSEISGGEKTVIKNGDQSISILASSRNVKIAGKTMVVESFIDISGRKEKERLLREKEAAQIASRDKSDFLLAITSELRSPMLELLDLTRTMLDGELSDPQLQFAESVFSSCGRLLSLTNDVGDLTRLEDGDIEITAEPFNLKRLLRGVIEEHKTDAEDKGLSLKLHFSPTTVDVFGDRRRIRRILHVLLENAIKFTNAGGVSVEAGWEPLSKDKGNLNISVADTGVGMSEDVKGKVFDKFFRHDMDNNVSGKGLGLGLTIASQLVNLMHGDIRLDSQPDVGTKFQLRIPLSVANSTEKSNKHPGTETEISLSALDDLLEE